MITNTQILTYFKPNYYNVPCHSNSSLSWNHYSKAYIMSFFCPIHWMNSRDFFPSAVCKMLAVIYFFLRNRLQHIDEQWSACARISCFLVLLKAEVDSYLVNSAITTTIAACILWIWCQGPGWQYLQCFIYDGLNTLPATVICCVAAVFTIQGDGCFKIFILSATKNLKISGKDFANATVSWWVARWFLLHLDNLFTVSLEAGHISWHSCWG